MSIRPREGTAHPCRASTPPLVPPVREKKGFIDTGAYSRLVDVAVKARSWSVAATAAVAAVCASIRIYIDYIRLGYRIEKLL